QKIVETLPGQQSPEKDNTAVQDTSATGEQAAAAADTLSLGSPISFKSSEQHSFNEWMQLINIKPLSRGKMSEETSPKRKDTVDLIEKFIAKKPRIQAPDKHRINEDISKQSIAENDHLMTETLARVYLEQKKYDKAVNAYRILSLKYPEKSGFFADRIKAIKILQKNNKS
ncbi:MAG: hypothetical protein QGH06_06935, partial [Lutibacter sp.]|nr:hypothetical protein [Lutibacter sp.]